MSRGKKPHSKSKVLNKSRTTPQPLREISYPSENIKTTNYEFEIGHKITTKFKKDSVILKLNVPNQSIGKFEFKQHLPAFLRYADEAFHEVEPSMFETVFNNEYGCSLAIIIEAGYDIRIEISKDNKLLVATLMFLSDWENILQNISNKMSKVPRT